MRIEADIEILTALNNRKSALLVELSNIDKALAAVTGDLDRPWSASAMDCIRRKKKFISTLEIIDCLFFNRKYLLEDKAQRKRFIGALSVALHKLVNKGLLASIDIPKFKGSLYGLPEWMKDGKPIDEYFKLPKMEKAA